MRIYVYKSKNAIAPVAKTLLYLLLGHVLGNPRMWTSRTSLCQKAPPKARFALTWTKCLCKKQVITTLVFSMVFYASVIWSNENTWNTKNLKQMTMRQSELVRSTCLLVLFMFVWISLGSKTRSVNSQPLWKLHSKGPSLVWPQQKGGDTSQGKRWWEKAIWTLLETGRVWGVKQLQQFWSKWWVIFGVNGGAQMPMFDSTAVQAGLYLPSGTPAPPGSLHWERPRKPFLWLTLKPRVFWEVRRDGEGWFYTLIYIYIFIYT